MAVVQVKARAGEQYRQSINARSHSFASDAEQQYGGKDSAPNPHELLLGSLGACTSITLQMYAQKKGWELKDVTIDLKDEELEDPANPGKKMTKITRDISVGGNLTQEQVDGLKIAADKCPIHKLLMGSKEIKTEIKRLTSV